MEGVKNYSKEGELAKIAPQTKGVADQTPSKGKGFIEGFFNWVRASGPPPAKAGGFHLKSEAKPRTESPFLTPFILRLKSGASWCWGNYFKKVSDKNKKRLLDTKHLQRIADQILKSHMMLRVERKL